MILDTNAVSSLLAGDTALEAVLAGSEQHHIPVIVTGEYRFGLTGSNRRRTLAPLFERLLAESIVLDVDDSTARQYAAIRRELKESGKPIPENDIWIAALGRQHGIPVVSRDPHFDVVHGLKRVSW